MQDPPSQAMFVDSLTFVGNKLLYGILICSNANLKVSLDPTCLINIIPVENQEVGSQEPGNLPEIIKKYKTYSFI